MKEDRAKTLAEQALADLKSELDAGMSDTLLKFIECLSRFHHYSWANCMLIAFQRPDATHVAGFRKWLAMKRCVRKETTKTVRETEAEAVSYAVCRAFNLDCSTRSSDYIQLYQGDSEVLGRSLERIQKTATRMIDGLNGSKQQEVAA